MCSGACLIGIMMSFDLQWFLSATLIPEATALHQVDSAQDLCDICAACNAVAAAADRVDDKWAVLSSCACCGDAIAAMHAALTCMVLKCTPQSHKGCKAL